MSSVIPQQRPARRRAAPKTSTCLINSLSDLRLFRISACGIGERTGKMDSIFDGKQHRLWVQTRPGRGVLSVHKEMAVRTDGFLCIGGACFSTGQSEREDSALGVQVFNTLRGHGQANLLPGRWTGSDHAGRMSSQHGKQQGVESAPGPSYRLNI